MTWDMHRAVLTGRASLVWLPVSEDSPKDPLRPHAAPTLRKLREKMDTQLGNQTPSFPTVSSLLYDPPLGTADEMTSPASFEFSDPLCYL